jgi:hypothetical protein
MYINQFTNEISFEVPTAPATPPPLNLSGNTERAPTPTSERGDSHDDERKKEKKSKKRRSHSKDSASTRVESSREEQAPKEPASARGERPTPPLSARKNSTKSPSSPTSPDVTPRIASASFRKTEAERIKERETQRRKSAASMRLTKQDFELLKQEHQKELANQRRRLSMHESVNSASS